MSQTGPPFEAQSRFLGAMSPPAIRSTKATARATWEGLAVRTSTGPVLHRQTFEQNPVGYLPWMIPSGVISAFRSRLTAKEYHQQPERRHLAPSCACSRTRAPSSAQASAVELMREIPLQLLAPLVPETACLAPLGPPPVGVDRPLPGRPPLPPAPHPPRLGTLAAQAHLPQIALHLVAVIGLVGCHLARLFRVHLRLALLRHHRDQLRYRVAGRPENLVVGSKGYPGTWASSA